jgi:hypothetical protein
MYDDPIGALEAELVAAARRRALGSSGTRWRPSFGGVMAAAAAAVAIVVALGAVVLLGGHGGSRSTGAQTAAPAKPLVQILGVLRTGQAEPIAVARALRQVDVFGRRLYGHGATISLLHSAAVPLAAGAGLLLDVRLAPLRSTPRRAAVGRATELLWLYVGRRLTGLANAEQLANQGLLGVERVSHGGVHVALIVPDGVARVQVQVPGERVLAAAVLDNVAQFKVPANRFVMLTVDSRMVWYAADGAVLRRVRRHPKVLHMTATATVSQQPTLIGPTSKSP